MVILTPQSVYEVRDNDIFEDVCCLKLDGNDFDFLLDDNGGQRATDGKARGRNVVVLVQPSLVWVC